MHLIRSTILFLFASIIFANTGIAQISVVPPSYNHIIAKAAQSEVLLKKQINLDTLPFVDDFALEGPFPNIGRWEDNHVFINTTLAVDPPSLGVATFDGLDKTGTPYGTDGLGDTLTSVGINLDINAQNLFLSYYVQPKGFGDAPESNDSLILEFKDVSGNWTGQRIYTGKDGFFPVDSVEFTFDFVEIVSAGFLHDDFQFRFRNTSSGRGAVDLWHLDVVRLNNNQVPSETYEDLAFQYPSQGVLNRYSAMPLAQFKASTDSHLRDTFNFSIFNHRDVARPIASQNSTMSIIELNSGQVVQAPEQYLTSVGTFDIDADTSLDITVVKELDIDGSSFGDQDPLHFQTIFSIEPVEADNDPGLLDNNFITQNTIIDDYYAYDDGSAELGIIAQGPGTQIAVEFQTTVAQTLSAVSFHFPHVSGDVTDQLFNLKVWVGSLDSDPVFVGDLLNTFYVDDLVDTLQGFTTYRLEDNFTGDLLPVMIGANTTFYVGWEQVSNEFADAIPVGFDNTSPDANIYNWYQVDGSDDWITFEGSSLSGAVMIRPVMGVENAITTSASQKITEEIVIYPNPTSGVVNIDWANTEQLSAQVVVFDVQGKLVHQQSGGNNDIQLGFLPAGIYLIHLSDQDNNILLREKLIIQPK